MSVDLGVPAGSGLRPGFHVGRKADGLRVGAGAMNDQSTIFGITNDECGVAVKGYPTRRRRNHVRDPQFGWGSAFAADWLYPPISHVNPSGLWEPGYPGAQPATEAEANALFAHVVYTADVGDGTVEVASAAPWALPENAAAALKTHIPEVGYEFTIANMSTGQPPTITTSAPHNIPSGTSYVCLFHDSPALPDPNGRVFTATVTGTSTFTVPWNITSAGVGGTGWVVHPIEGQNYDFDVMSGVNPSLWYARGHGLPESTIAVEPSTYYSASMWVAIDPYPGDPEDPWCEFWTTMQNADYLLEVRPYLLGSDDDLYDGDDPLYGPISVAVYAARFGVTQMPLRGWNRIGVSFVTPPWATRMALSLKWSSNIAQFLTGHDVYTTGWLVTEVLEGDPDGWMQTALSYGHVDWSAEGAWALVSPAGELPRRWTLDLGAVTKGLEYRQPPVDYFDGDSPGCSWTGAAHRSESVGGG